MGVTASTTTYCRLAIIPGHQRKPKYFPHHPKIKTVVLKEKNKKKIGLCFFSLFVFLN